MKSKIYNKKFDPWIIFLLITAVLVTVSAVLVHQSFIRVMPLYVSVFIMLLMSKANRYAYLIGGLNAISYGFIALYYDIPGSAISAFFVSFPLQIVSFIRWSKSSWKATTVFKKMSLRGRIINVVLITVIWAGYYAVIKALGSASSLIDSMASLLGMYITLLQVLKYSEYTILMIPSGLLSISLYISLITKGNIEQVPFLIYSCYSLCCVIRSVFNVKRIIKEQESELK